MTVPINPAVQPSEIQAGYMSLVSYLHKLNTPITFSECDMEYATRFTGEIQATFNSEERTMTIWLEEKKNTQ